MTHKNIIIAVDNTDEAEEVVSAAQQLAAGDATITLMTVVRPIPYAFTPEQTALVNPNFNIEEEAAKAAKAGLERLATDHKISGEQVVVIGSPASEIRNRAEESGADLIVIGSHGRHGLGLLLGSTANGVLHGAPCNVYVVRIKTE